MNSTVKLIEKFLDQKCIGYQKDINGNMNGSVIQSTVRFKDNTIGIVYQVSRYSYDSSTGLYYQTRGQLTESRPRIDINS